MYAAALDGLGAPVLASATGSTSTWPARAAAGLDAALVLTGGSRRRPTPTRRGPPLLVADSLAALVLAY